MQKTQYNQHGFSPIIIVAAITVLAVAVIGGWLVYKKDSLPPANANTKAVREALKNATCNDGNADICRLFTAWKASRYYIATTTTVVGRTTNTSITKVDGQNYYAKINAELTHETIVIGTALYTKDTDKNKWYKQTLTQPGTTGFGFDAQMQNQEGRFTYKKIGTEVCGELTCLHYRITDAADHDLRHDLWFDNQDYQLRKQVVRQQGVGGANTATTTFTYDKVTISEPSPYTELRKDEIYLPGQGIIRAPATP